MQPTSIGGSTSREPAREVAIAKPAAALTILPTNFPVALTDEETTKISTMLDSTSIATLTLRDIAVLESEPEVALQRVLDGFLSKIDQFDNPQLFALFKKLSDTVDAQHLPDIAEKILNAKPSTFESILLFFRSKKARQAAMERIWGETQQLAKGHTKTLVDLIADMERQLASEQRKLELEIASMEQLKDAYRERFRDFAIATGFMQALLLQARDYVASQEAAADPNDPVQKAHIDELRDKLQALESRALALEGTLTCLPADQLVIRQLQNAGISTLQETTTTAMTRFGSIKMTLLTLHGALVTKNVQRLAQQGADLDHNLQAVRSMVMKDVVTTAANAPGDNRLAQANDLQRIVAETKELQGIVETARVTNAQKFAQARVLFDNARKDMLGLGQQIHPGRPIK